MTGIDVIGDVHGQADMLRRLLEKLGYAYDGASWSHPTRTAMFIGDLIDRNPGQLEVLDIVRRMVDRGAARIVMGNHEFNAIAWATRHPSEPDAYLRPHSRKNREQHDAFLDAVGAGSAFHHDTIEWFKTIPLWLEVDGARFVHACWDPAAIELLRERVGPDNTLTTDVLVEASTKGTAPYAAIEHLLKGPEIDLPDGFDYLDKGGHHRTRARMAWWRHDADTLRAAALIPNGTTRSDGESYPELPDIPVKPPTPPYRDRVPVFVGHYWETDTPRLYSPRIACVDYSAGKHGDLVAYRWDGETDLSPTKFVSVESMPWMKTYAGVASALRKSQWVPESWLALPGQRTPSGHPALFRSNAHALMALRILFLEQRDDMRPIDLEERRRRYEHGWARFVQNCHDMRKIVALLEAGDHATAVARWNDLDQVAADNAFRVVLGERERFDGRSVAVGAARHFGLTSASIPRDERDRALRPADHDDAWNRSHQGVCRGCGTPTISHAQRRLLHAALTDPALGFDIEPTYRQHDGKPGALWEQLTIAARGVAEHVEPWSRGGKTDITNLTNACAGCNYARGDMDMDAAGVAAYDRPAAELAAGRS